ncbi:MAG: hypothetical protein K9W44_12785 [Candidatus Lokiarchaeota archaeon]|nr:hypothetical protein [Candidatus Harpocratesius repetitus]
MAFTLPIKKRKCPRCGEKILDCFVEICPKCGFQLDKTPKPTAPEFFLKKSQEFLENVENSTNQEYHETKIQKFKKSNVSSKQNAHLSFIKSLKIQKNPEIISSSFESSQKEERNSLKIKDFKIQKLKIDGSIAKLKTDTKVTRIQVEQEKIPLGISGEYIKYIGIITKEREKIFSLNKTFTYLLDLSINLEYIATSILSGQLDRMFLASSDGKEQEICYFAEQKEFLFVLYGKIPEKKANWLTQQLIISVKDYFHHKNINQMTKLEKYEISQKFRSKIKFLLETIIDLNDVFTSTPIKTLSKGFRVDYFGLSYQSIGVLSKMITTELKLKDLPPLSSVNEDDFDDMIELQEAIITAKVEAIAANTFANTLMTPEWISVKLGFQQYRFIIFSHINDYYLSLLAEGNLELRKKIFSELTPLLMNLTNHPFVGILTEYSEAAPRIVEFLQKMNKTKFDSS